MRGELSLPIAADAARRRQMVRVASSGAAVSDASAAAALVVVASAAAVGGHAAARDDDDAARGGGAEAQEAVIRQHLAQLILLKERCANNGRVASGLGSATTRKQPSYVASMLDDFATAADANAEDLAAPLPRRRTPPVPTRATAPVAVREAAARPPPDADDALDDDDGDDDVGAIAPTPREMSLDEAKALYGEAWGGFSKVQDEPFCFNWRDRVTGGAASPRRTVSFA